ncbi:MAG TPA: S41 family peptidase [Candidatus Absconditabacterales bacterium]|nr:S41 family peptidase [Candidatus Absconditabacterales bacterium]
MRKINGFLLFLLGILLGGIIIKLGPVDIINQSMLASRDTPIKYYQDKYERFELVDKILEQGFYNYENVDKEFMVKEALKSYVNGMEDSYTVYMDADQNSGFMGSLEGEEEFEGIGAIVNKKDYYILIEEVLKESPAFKAGIKPLDRVIKIDNKYVESETLDEAVSRMKGPAGTDVKIIIERFDGEERTIIDVVVTREKINIPSVKSKVIELENQKIGYIEMFIIGEETENLFKKEVKTLAKEDLDGIILDLRGNGGGLMPIAVEIASHFVPKNELVVSAKYKGYEDEKYFSKGFGEFESIKTVVLIDGMTASAGEIIAMALQEQAGATLLGTKSFGKGTIQTMDEFQDGDSIKYTIGKWFAPSKKNIDKIGVDPDVIVEFDVDSYIESNIDNQLEEAKDMFEK